LALDLRGFRVRSFAPSAPPARDAEALAANALDQPIEGPSLTEIVRGRQSATVVVPDQTRKASLPLVLPPVIERLRRAGIPESAIVILVANGTHPAVGESALATLLGPISKTIQVIQHDSLASDLAEVGELRPGIPVRLHPTVIENDCLITISSVRHHYFAGFGGGPKMIFPGVGGYEEIQANHGLVLDTQGDRPVRHPGCEPGVLHGNPVAEEIQRAANLRPPDLALCLVEGRDGGVAWISAGPWRPAFEAAVEQVRSWFEVPGGEKFELMVACAGGRPTDSTLIQAHKSLDAACRFMAPGGELLLLACLDGGLGSDDMVPFVDDPAPPAILARLSARWVQYGHTTLRIIEKTSGHRVRLYSELENDTALRLGFEPAADPEAVLDSWRESHSGAHVAVLAGSAVYPRIS
jgi:nickel-dependent lactate racemase